MDTLLTTMCPVSRGLLFTERYRQVPEADSPYLGYLGLTGFCIIRR